MASPGHLPAEALEAALALAGVGCWQWHTEGRSLRVSANFHQLLGNNPGELPATPEDWLQRVHADDRPQLAVLFDKLATNAACGQPGFTLRLKHASGLWHWFEVRLPATQAEDNAPIVVTFNEITQQKQAEAALRDSQLRFRALYNTAPLAFILWDREGRITEWNRRAEQMFGWSAGEVIGKPVHRLLLSSDRHGAFTDTVRGAMHGTGNGIFSGPAIAKNGRCLECNWYNVALHTPNGKLLGILSLVLDVTDERLVHQRLEKSEKVYRTLVETSPDAILLLGMDGRLKMANQQANHLFGLDELTDLATTNIRDLLSDYDAERLGNPDFLDHPEDFDGFIASRQLSMQSRDGLRFEAGTSFSTIMDSSGRASGIVLFVRDITEKLRAERELDAHRQNLERLVTERTAELEGTRDTLAKIIDSSPVPAFVIDADHVVTHWNRACEQIIGVPAADILGTRDHWQAFYPAQRPIMADLVITGEMTLIQKLYSNKYRKSQLIDGAFEAEDYFPLFNRWLFFTAAPLRDKHGQIIGAIETLQDISERKLAEIELSGAKLAAETAANAKTEFLANMSHEIRTPMNAVIGLAHLLLKTELTDKQRDFISRIHGAGQMLLGLINDILDFSKIDAGRMQLEETEFALDGVLDNVTSVLLHRAQEKILELQYVVDPDVPSNLNGDPLRLGQILINLIGNAIKFTAKGSITVFVRRLPDDNGLVHLEFDVQDTGIGMSPAQQQSLFNAFSQADTSITRKFGGTGLGLTISKRLAQLMKGDIWVRSQPNLGSTFTFSVKLAHGRDNAPTPNLVRRRALVVDDSPLARSILIALLEKQGYTALPAESGEQALAMLGDTRTARFEFVTIDLNMPGMDGLELADAIRNQIVPPPKLVMVTAADTATLVGETRLRCFDAVLNKPVTAAQIGKLINQGKPPALAVPGKPAPLAGLRVLLVEDMPTNQLIAGEILESFGITVDMADNGVQAITKLLTENNSYDIVLMDIQMPEMDGLEATRRLRANSRLDALPIIAMTAHAMDSERQRCLDVGMNDFVTKPIDPDGLRDILIRWRPTLATPAQANNKESAPMSSADGLPDLPGIDKADGLRRMMNKPALYEKVLRDFHARFMAEPGAIRDAMQAGDYATAERRAHSTKGLAGTIGAQGLQTASKELELALRQGEALPDGIFQRFENELNAVIASIAQGFRIE